MAMPRLANFGQALMNGFGRLSDGPSMPGLMPDENQAATERHRMAMLSQILQATQPSRTPQSGLAAIGQGIMAGQQAKDQYGADTLRAKLYKAQMAQMGSGADRSTANILDYQQAVASGYAGSFTDYLKEFQGREANVSSNVQNAKYFESLTPEQRQRYVEANRNVPIETINQVPTRVLAGGTQQPLSTLQSEASAAGAMNQARAEGTETGTARGTAIANLPVIKSSVRAALETADKMLEHPGMATATGMSGWLDPRNYLPGTDARDFGVLKNQAQGQVFLDAYQSLKGGGVITEVEGLKAEQAKARMDTAQSDQEFRAALNDYKAALMRGLQLAEDRAGMTTGGGFGGPEIQAPQSNQAPANPGGVVDWSQL